MTKKVNFSQKTKKRPRRTYLKDVGAVQVLPITSTRYYDSWAAIRHLCNSRDGFIIYISPASFDRICNTPKLNLHRIELVNEGFSFQIFML